MADIGTLPIDISRILQSLFARGYTPPGLEEETEEERLLREEEERAMMGGGVAPELARSHEIPGRAGPQQPTGPAQNSWDAFIAMNPNLDLDKVARQAGGRPGSFPVTNEYGGEISDNSQNVLPPGQTDQDLQRTADKITLQNQMEASLDPRSRSYDQGGAKTFLVNAAFKEEQRKQETIDKLLSGSGDMAGGGSPAPPGLMKPEVAMALRNAGVAVPDRAIDRQMGTIDYANAVQSMRAKALTFLDRTSTDVRSSAYGPDAKVLSNYHKSVAKIAQQYPDRPDIAYQKIMQLQLLFGVDEDTVDTEAIQAEESAGGQGVWGTRKLEDGTEDLVFGSIR